MSSSEKKSCKLAALHDATLPSGIALHVNGLGSRGNNLSVKAKRTFRRRSCANLISNIYVHL